MPDLRVALKTLDSFRFHHGGGEAGAEAEIRLMLEDFLLVSARRDSASGYLVLAREGFELTLSPARDAVVAYRTVHRERTWSQVKAGVSSRLGKRQGRQSAGPYPDPGAPFVWKESSEVLSAVDPWVIYLTHRVRNAFDRRFKTRHLAEDGLDQMLREMLAADLGSTVEVDTADNGLLLFAGKERTWLITPDLRSLIGLKATSGEALGAD